MVMMTWERVPQSSPKETCGNEIVRVRLGRAARDELQRRWNTTSIRLSPRGAVRGLPNPLLIMYHNNKQEIHVFGGVAW